MSSMESGLLSKMLLDIEEHITIQEDRSIVVPNSLKKIAVQYDHNVRTVTFDCPRYTDGRDLSTMGILINYILPDGTTACVRAENVVVDELDETVLHFDWTILDTMTRVNGALTFLVCAKRTNEEGIVENHWNTELNTDLRVSKGIDCSGYLESIVERYPDLITQVLTNLTVAEGDIRTLNDCLDTVKTQMENQFDGVTTSLQNLSEELSKKYVKPDTGIPKSDLEEGAIPTKMSDLVQDVETGKIDSIAINGEEQTIDENKQVNLRLSSGTSHIEYDETKNAIKMSAPRIDQRQLELDTTLSESNLAADAKSTGDKINEVLLDVNKIRDIFAPAWDSSTLYEVGDYVVDEGSMFRCLTKNTGQKPDLSSSYWEYCRVSDGFSEWNNKLIREEYSISTTTQSISFPDGFNRDNCLVFVNSLYTKYGSYVNPTYDTSTYNVNMTIRSTTVEVKATNDNVTGIVLCFIKI